MFRLKILKYVINIIHQRHHKLFDTCLGFDYKENVMILKFPKYRCFKPEIKLVLC